MASLIRPLSHQPGEALPAWPLQGHSTPFCKGIRIVSLDYRARSMEGHLRLMPRKWYTGAIFRQTIGTSRRFTRADEHNISHLSRTLEDGTISGWYVYIYSLYLLSLVVLVGTASHIVSIRRVTGYGNGCRPCLCHGEDLGSGKPDRLICSH